MTRAKPAALRILYRLVAVWFITLIALPFTAPFKTFDLGVWTVEASLDTSLTKPVTLPVVLAAAPPPQPAGQVDIVRTFTGGSDHYRILHTVLRV